MKSIKNISLMVVAVVTLSSCDLLFGHKEPVSESVMYNLALVFQDASGEDLVKSLTLEEGTEGKFGKVQTDQYKLEILLSRPLLYNGTFYRKQYDGAFNCLFSTFELDADHYRDESRLTYKLSCPSVFGDKVTHELVTYWDIPDKPSADLTYQAYCVRIEFDGREIIPSYQEKVQGYLAVIRLGEQ